jgi:hypothetical protein
MDDKSVFILLSARLPLFCYVLEIFIPDLQQHFDFNNPHFHPEF